WTCLCPVVHGARCKRGTPARRTHPPGRCCSTAEERQLNILVVCSGNTCRSPMAAGLLKTMAQAKGLATNVRSAGFAHHPGAGVAENAIKVMAEIGIDISNDYSKPLTPEHLKWAELVLAVQHNHADHLIEEFPHLASSIRCLESDVHDP